MQTLDKTTPPSSQPSESGDFSFNRQTLEEVAPEFSRTETTSTDFGELEVTRVRLSRAPDGSDVSTHGYHVRVLDSRGNEKAMKGYSAEGGPGTIFASPDYSHLKTPFLRRPVSVDQVLRSLDSEN